LFLKENQEKNCMVSALRSAKRYPLKRLLGAGGMGVTYLAAYEGSEGFEKQVVVKRLHPNLTHDPMMVDALISEARLAVMLDHPHIVSIYDLLHEENEYSLVMEYIDGCPLSFWMQNVEKLEPEIILCVVMQLLLALDYAHKRTDANGQPLHIIHRDISPDNVLLAHNGFAKLTDFGLAKIRNQLDKTQPGTIKGKYGYMSPEQARGQRLDQRTDLYAVGILLYEGLAGRRLYQAEHPLRMLQLSATGTIQPLHEVAPQLHPSLIDIVHKALQSDPEQRFQNAWSFYDALEVFVLPWSLEKMRRLLEEKLHTFLAEKRFEEHQKTSSGWLSTLQNKKEVVSIQTNPSVNSVRQNPQTHHAILSEHHQKPLIYLLHNESIFPESLCNQIANPWQGRKAYQFEILRDKADISHAMDAIKNLDRVPDGVLFAGLQVALQHPFLAALRSHQHTVKLLVLEQPQSEIVELAVELCGVTATLQAPLTLDGIQQHLRSFLDTHQSSDRLHTLQKRLESSTQIEIAMRSRVDALAAANIRAVQLLEELNAKNKELEAKDHFLGRISRTLLTEDMHAHRSGCFMRGELREMPLTDIFQLLNLSRKSACVTLIRKEDPHSASLFFEKGEVVDACYGVLRGEPVIELLFRWSDAHFMLQALPAGVETTIHKRTDQLLLDLLRRIDEAHRSSSSTEWSLPEGDSF
jgi:serine/threonine protein kinase